LPCPNSTKAHKRQKLPKSGKTQSPDTNWARVKEQELNCLFHP